MNAVTIAFMSWGYKMSDERTKKVLAQLIEELDLAIIKAKAQLEYMED